MVRVTNATTDEELACWWDDDVRGLIEAGFLDPRDWKRSAKSYLQYLGFLR